MGLNVRPMRAYNNRRYSHTCRGADSGAWIAAAHLLFYGDGRRNPFDKVTFRLAHTSQELWHNCSDFLHNDVYPQHKVCRMPGRIYPNRTTRWWQQVCFGVFLRLYFSGCWRAPLMSMELFLVIIWVTKVNLSCKDNHCNSNMYNDWQVKICYTFK